MTHLLEQIKAHSTRLFEKTQQTRRHLHAHPELSFEEFETARFVAERLRNLGLSPQEGIAGTGVVVTIEGTKAPSSRVIGLRADMDALPILEQNEVTYSSTKPGVMHACGHDVHTSSLLSTAEILTELRHEYEGPLNFVFKTAE